MPKASPEAISLGGGLIVGGLLSSLGINNNNIISGIPNLILSPSNLRYVMKKSREDILMRIAGFFCNCNCSMSCNKGESDGLRRMVKEIAFWGGKIVQLIRLGSYTYKVISEEVAKALDTSLNQIDP